jgi:hypothetical protein
MGNIPHPDRYPARRFEAMLIEVCEFRSRFAADELRNKSKSNRNEIIPADG